MANKPNINVLYGNPISLQLAAIGITNLFGGVKLTEKNRTTSTKRIFNPSDHTQYVDIKRIETLIMADENKQEHHFAFNNTD